MILVIGDSSDPVISRLRSVLDKRGHSHVLLDATRPKPYSLTRSVATGRVAWHLKGAECEGKRHVGSIFARRGALGDPERRLPALKNAIDRMLDSTSCHVVNRPSSTSVNYAKAHQLRSLGTAGFLIPDTIVTGLPRSAFQFIVEHQGRVLIKGLSSVKTIPTAIGPQHLQELDSLIRCPVQLQEIIAGKDIRLTIIGGRAFASVADRDGRFQTLPGAAVLPVDHIERSIDFVAHSGLRLAGFDFAESVDGRFYVFEMNPNPLITHYESDAIPKLTDALCDDLIVNAVQIGDILV